MANNLPSKSSNGLSISRRIKDSSEDEIKQALRYIMALIGVPENKIPQDITRDLMINYIKTNWANTEIDEMKQAFIWAVEKRPTDKKGNALTTLYDRPFNIDFIKSIIIKFRESKPTESKPIIGLNTNQNALAVIDLLKEKNPNIINELKALAEKKYNHTSPIRERTSNEKLLDAFIRRFDKLDPKNKGWIKIAGQGKMTLSDYISYRYENYKERFGLNTKKQ